MMKRWAYRIFAFAVLPVALLAIMEGGLRVCGYGCSSRFVVKKQLGDGTAYLLNKAFYQQFFRLPVDSIVTWDDLEFAVKSRKDENAYRIFVFGGSAANGMPPDSAYAFWRILDAMLRTRFPNTRFEVFNAACPGANSNVMWAAARACARLDPDLFVVYMGINEAIGPFGPATRFAKGPCSRLFLIRASIRLANLRLAQLLTGRGKTPPRPPVVKPDDIWQYYSPLDPGDPRLEDVYEHFEANLEGICEAASEAGAAVVLCTVGCNLKNWGPHISGNRADLLEEERQAWQSHFEAGIAAEESGLYAQALDAYAEATAIDDTHAELTFRAGRCHCALGARERARQCFLRMLDLDRLQTWPNTRIDAVIGKVGAARAGQGVYLADAAGYLAERSVDGLPGRELFCDSVHPSFTGHYEIARAVFDQAVRALPEDVRAQARDSLAAPPQSECERRLALTPWVLRNHYRTMLDIMPKFMEDVLLEWRDTAAWYRSRIGALEDNREVVSPKAAAEAYRQAIDLAPYDYYLHCRYIQVLMSMGDMARALEQARVCYSRFPDRRAVCRLLGMLLARSEREDEAVEILDATLSLYPDDAPSYFEKGQALQAQGKTKEALDAYRRAVNVDSSNVHYKCKEGEALEHLGRHRAALDAYRKALALKPNSETPYRCLDGLLQKTGDNGSRIQQWRTAVERYPEIAVAHYYLGMALDSAGDFEAAASAYAAACALDPQYDSAATHSRARVFMHAGLAFQRAEDLDAAIDAYLEAIALAPDDGETRMLLAEALKAKGDLDGSKQAFRDAIEIDPSDFRSYDQLDALYVEQGDVAGRIGEWRTMTDAHPQAARAYFHLGMALEAAAELGPAIAAYREAGQLDPTDPAMQASLGQALVRAGAFWEARTPLRAALDLNADIDTIRQDLVRTLFETGDYEAARDEIAECRKRNIALPSDLSETLRKHEMTVRDSSGR